MELWRGPKGLGRRSRDALLKLELTASRDGSAFMSALEINAAEQNDEGCQPNGASEFTASADAFASTALLETSAGHNGQAG